MATKILVAGPVQGHLRKTIEKIAKLHAKQNFAFVLITGDLFGNEVDEQTQALLDHTITLPVPTYFTVGDSMIPGEIQARIESTGEVAHNLFYLGRKGTLTTSEGVKIVYLGGRQVQNEASLTNSIGKYDPLFTENEARELHGAHDCHILLTNQWPTRIENGSQIAITSPPESQSTGIMNLCATLKPRYHFSHGTQEGWKREPFCWPLDYSSEDPESKVTRFESVGTFGLKDWLSAFVLDLSKSVSFEGAQRTAPFAAATKRKQETYTTAGNDSHYDNSAKFRGKRNKKQRHQPNYDPNDCFMCLGKPTFAAEMVVSIADEAFATSLRGPLSTESTFPQLKSTGNLMIIPLYHAADETAHGRRPVEEQKREFEEMTKYRHALQHMLMDKASGELGAVCWEVNRTGIRHFHWQWIACPKDIIDKGLVEAGFKVASEKNEYERFQPCDPDSLIKERQSDYFRVWIWSPTIATKNGSEADQAKIPTSNGVSSPVEHAAAIAAGEDEKTVLPLATSEKSMYFEVPQDQKFNIQFGRSVVSGLLKLESRADWRAVPANDGDEARDAEAWKQDFKDWDFAMN